MLREKLFIGIFLFLAGGPLLAANSVLVPTPRAKVVPVTATNRPFLAAARTQRPLVLATRGYSETELTVRGYASVYDWAPTGSEELVVVRAGNQPYVTRLLVRRPIEPGKSSGRVIVELLDPAGRHDAAPLWGMSYEHFLRRGDAWVGVTIQPDSIATLQKFDAVRYRDLSLSPAGQPACAVAGADSGLAWDVIAQVGMLLRSSSKENPLLDLNPQRLIVAGYAGAGGYVITFANAMHRRLRLGDDAPVFDAYFTASSTAAVAISRCAPPLLADDPRRAILPRRVPFIAVATQADFNRLPALRRADSDADVDVFRLFEIAGIPGGGAIAAGVASPADLAIAGSAAGGASCTQPGSDLPVDAAFNAIWQQLDDLLVRRQPMSSAPRIDADAALAPTLDANGNAAGGWRLPQVDLPVARYSTCAAAGVAQRLDATKLKSLYRTRTEYLRRFNAAVDQAARDRRLVKEDADAMKAVAARSVPVF